jgi:RimJ/RimL family protein N-acetyltransferase
MADMTDVPVCLRPFGESDLGLLTRFASDPAFSAPFEWSGYRSAGDFRRRWEEDAFLNDDPHYLVVADPDGAPVGWVMWEHPYRGLGGTGAWVIGALLAPEHRGRGVGTAAHHLLLEHLFDTTTAHRLCAFTEADNVAEQRTLDKCGFHREGVLREAGFRGGEWRDVIAYGLLRQEHRVPARHPVRVDVDG